VSKRPHAPDENGKPLCGRGSKIAPDPAAPSCVECRRALYERSEDSPQPRYAWLASTQREFGLSTEQVVLLLGLENDVALGVWGRQNSILPEKTVKRLRYLVRRWKSGISVEEDLGNARVRAEQRERDALFVKNAQREFKLTDSQLVILLGLNAHHLRLWAEAGKIPDWAATKLRSLVQGWNSGVSVEEDLASARIDCRYSWLKEVQHEFKLSHTQLVTLLGLNAHKLGLWAKSGEIPEWAAKKLGFLVRGWRRGHRLEKDLENAQAKRASYLAEQRQANLMRTEDRRTARLDRRARASSAHIVRGTGGKKPGSHSGS
jgi:hypothetical protein